MKITKEEVQRILYSFANLKIDKGSAEHNTLFELLGRHPDVSKKVGAGVDYFFVQQSKWKKNQFNFMIQRVDGTTTDFSFIKCLNPTNKNSKGRNWTGIFRNVVKEQVDTFRVAAFEVVGDKDKFICSQTSLKFPKMNSHVDHVYPLTFDSIMLEFINLHKIDLSKIKLSIDNETSEIQEILDKEITTLFYDFHKERSVLRVVCSNANLQGKKTKNYNGKNPVQVKKKMIKLYPQYHNLQLVV